MTTIALHYPTRTIAADGRATLGDGTIINEEEVKIVTASNGDVLAMSGDLPLIEVVVASWPHFTEDDLQGVVGQEVRGIIYSAEDDEFISYVLSTNGDMFNSQWTLTYNYAVGSGGTWAMAAMDMGESAYNAVAYAMTRDSATGGRILEMCLADEGGGDE